jgi:hypothetical protein
MVGAVSIKLFKLLYRVLRLYGYFFCILSIGYFVEQFIFHNSKIELTFFYFYDIFKNGACFCLVLYYLYTISYGKFKNELKISK